MKANSSEIIFVVDRSGSMSRIADDMIGGFEAFIKAQKETPGECKVSLARFDHEYEMVYEGKPLDQVGALELVPRGNTALLDAIGRTINTTGARLSAMPEDQRPSHVLFVIITDGRENHSREFTMEAVRSMVTLQRDTYKWEFLFLGADLDSIEVAQSYGFLRANAAVYQPNAKGSRALFSATARAASSYRTGAAGGQSLNVQEEYNKAFLEEKEDK